MSAWNPLQMPHISPSRRSKRSVTPSFTAAFRKKAVMNLPEPSGSSPPENPPGMNTICASRSALANLSTLREMPSAVRLLMTMISASAPASRITLALSYSQLVPGKAGMSTLGRAHFTVGAARFSVT